MYFPIFFTLGKQGSISSLNAVVAAKCPGESNTEYELITLQMVKFQVTDFFLYHENFVIYVEVSESVTI